MATVEELEILIDVMDSFTRELDQLLILLVDAEAMAKLVERIRIDVDVDDADLDTLLAKMGAAKAGGAAGVRMRGGGAGAAAMGAAAGGRGGADVADAMEDTTRVMRNFADTTDEASGLFDLRMTDMHNALAKLVPVLLVLIGALPALITALVALGAAAIAAAAALIAIAGFGALGFAIAEGGVDNLGEGIMVAVEEVVDDLLDAFAPLAGQLEPLFRDMLDGLDRLFQAIANRGDVLMALADDARAFGGFLMDWIPNTLANMARMVEAFGPLFGQLGDFMLENSLLRFLTQFMADSLPAFMAFLDVMIEMLPTILRISIGFLDMLSIILRIIDIFGRFVGVLGISEEAFGLLIAGVLTAITAMNIFSFSAIGNAILAVTGLVESLYLAVIAADTYTLGMSYATIATNALKWALRALIATTVVGLGLVALGAVAEFIADEFFRTADGISAATSALRDFDNVAGRTRSGGAPASGVTPGAVTSGRFMAGAGGGSTSMLVDNRGRDREDADAQLDRALWQQKKQSGNSTAGNASGT